MSETDNSGGHEASSRLVDIPVSWQLEQDAVSAELSYACLVCEALTRFRIIEQSNAVMLDDGVPLPRAAARHLAQLAEYYHASGWVTTQTCENGHSQNNLYVFGETQPARYVLVNAGSTMNGIH